MSGEAGGFVVGAGLLLIGGPLLISAALVATVVGVVGVTAAGVGTLTMQGGKSLVGRHKRRIDKDNVNTDADMERMFTESLEMCETQIRESLLTLNSLRNEGYQEVKAAFDKSKSLEQFVNFVEESNMKLSSEMYKIRETIICEYGNRSEEMRNKYEKEFSQYANIIKDKINEIEDDSSLIQEQSYEYVKEYYQYIESIINTLEAEYPVSSVQQEIFQMLKEELEAISKSINEEKKDYQDLIIALEALPIRILEYKEKCEKEIMGRGLYYSACISKLEEIRNILYSDIMQNAVADVSELVKGTADEENVEFNIKEYMKGSYDYIEDQLERYRGKLEGGYELIAENELVDNYRKIVDLHTYTVNEMFNAVERYRNALMRDEMNSSIVTDLQKMGYIIQSMEDVELKPDFSVVCMYNPETEDYVTIRIEERIGLGSKLCKEIENKISIRHNSEDRDLTYVEEHRKEIRECLEQAINNNEKLVSNSFRTKDINCDMETYKKNPEREG